MVKLLFFEWWNSNASSPISLVESYLYLLSSFFPLPVCDGTGFWAAGLGSTSINLWGFKSTAYLLAGYFSAKSLLSCPGSQGDGASARASCEKARILNVLIAAENLVTWGPSDKNVSPLCVTAKWDSLSQKDQQLAEFRVAQPGD